MTEPAMQPPRLLAPSFLSAQAQAFINAPVPTLEWPDLADAAGWQQLITVADGATRGMAERRLPPPDVLSHELVDIGGVPTYVLTPAALADTKNGPLFVDIHGGALVMTGGDLSWKVFAPNAAERCGVTWAPDYRNPPGHPYPAALDDCVEVYRAAIGTRHPSEIILTGGSAGGNLAAATLLRAKDEGLPMPAALVLLSPELDLTESGDSVQIASDLGYAARLMTMNLLYANGQDLTDPYISPLFGDVVGFPPTFLQSGTRDMFLSNTVRMHRRLLAAGVEVELHVFEAMPHGFGWDDSPEDMDCRASQRRFERTHLQLGAIAT